MKPSRRTAACYALATLAASSAAAQGTGAQDRVTVTGAGDAPLMETLTGDSEAFGATGVTQTPMASPQLGGGGGGGSVISYAPDYFAPYNPTNALDMVNRVPGFSANSGGNARGFGQNAGNILINGERPSAKSQDADDILQRIPVNQIIRIDLIRGQAPGIEMSGQTVVVNVIRRITTESSGTWSAQVNYNGNNGDFEPSAEINRTFTLLGANITGGLAFSDSAMGYSRREMVLSPTGGALQRNLLRGEGGPHNWRANFIADRQFGEWTLRLNGRYSDGGYSNVEYVKRIEGIERLPTQLDAEGRPVWRFPEERFLRYDFEPAHMENEERQWELGGDLDRRLTQDLSLKIIVLANRKTQHGANRFDIYSNTTGQISSLSSQLDNTSGESILRSFVTWTPREDISLEVGAEGAFNYLDSFSGVSGQADNATRIEEIRAEPYVAGVWRIRPGLTLDAGFQAEVSEISQSGAATRARNFFYPKGSAALTWDVRPRTQLRIGAQRTVGQLSFSDFQRSVNFQENLLNAGNPDLVPEQTWTIEGVLEQRFWDDGVLSVELSRKWIEDAEGFLPIVLDGPNGRIVTEGPGNLGDASEWEIEITADVPLDRIGLRNARLLASYEYEHTRVIDPFTGRNIPMEASFFGPRSLEITYRQDHPGAGVSWGVTYMNTSTSYSHRLHEITAVGMNNGGLDAFIETTRFFGVNMRLQINNIGNLYTERYRQRFAGPRDALAMPGAVEWRRQFDKIGFVLRVRGNF